MSFDYNLYKEQKTSTSDAFRKMLGFMKDEKKNLFIALFVMLINSAISMCTPLLIGYAIDHYIQTKIYNGLLTFSGILFVLYLISGATEYFQTNLMGSIGQRMLYSLRNEVFNRIQNLPVAFFNQNKAGDLISRINNDTDKVNQFFSQSLMQFVDSIFTMLAAAIFILFIHFELGGASLIPAVLILIFVNAVSGFVKKKNAASMKSTGALSAEIQENISNFKSIVAFNRREYFINKFEIANRENYKASIGAGLVNNMFLPVFSFFSNIAQLIVLAFGIYLISKGNFTIGLLVSFLAYTRFFYQPLRQIASLWASFQTAMAAWDRIAVILQLESNLFQIPSNNNTNSSKAPLLVFENVSFSYPNGKKVLHDINFSLDKGKTYAFVGPTGGGKTTTASLVARLYDPTEGKILLDGKDLKTYSGEERSNKIGFILQDPFLFNGTIRENILYGNETLKNLDEKSFKAFLKNSGLDHLITGFEQGTETPVVASGDSMSLGEKQIIAFIRAVLRNPEILILDEATANIDTVTEKMLEEIMEKLPKSTVRIIIAHRLNTIENADEIFFINSGQVTNAGNLENAIKLLTENKRES